MRWPHRKLKSLQNLVGACANAASRGATPEVRVQLERWGSVLESIQARLAACLSRLICRLTRWAVPQEDSKVVKKTLTLPAEIEQFRSWCANKARRRWRLRADTPRPGRSSRRALHGGDRPLPLLPTRCCPTARRPPPRLQSLHTRLPRIRASTRPTRRPARLSRDGSSHTDRMVL